MVILTRFNHLLKQFVRIYEERDVEIGNCDRFQNVLASRSVSCTVRFPIFEIDTAVSPSSVRALIRNRFRMK